MVPGVLARSSGSLWVVRGVVAGTPAVGTLRNAGLGLLGRMSGRARAAAWVLGIQPMGKPLESCLGLLGAWYVNHWARPLDFFFRDAPQRYRVYNLSISILIDS